MIRLLFLAAPAIGFVLASEPIPAPTAAQIMAQVAANQDRAIELRREFVYEQRIRVETRKTNGKLLRDETAEYEALPGPSGTEKHLKAVRGRYWKKGRYIDFTGEPAPDKREIDGDIISDFREDLVNEKSKDGLSNDLFPLTSAEQKKYRFELLGEQLVQGRKTWRIAFRPADRGDIDWAGEALIDQQECQPVNVYTKLSRRIPFAVRTLLGIDLPGIGFNVKYQRFDEGLWFPVSLGSEFGLHVLFFFNRQISVSMENTGFRRTTVDSTVRFAEPGAAGHQTESPPPSPPPSSIPPLSE